jgi:hypothetical protein
MSNSHEVKIEVNLGVLRSALSALKQQARDKRVSASKIHDAGLRSAAMSQAARIEREAAELERAIGNAEMA